MELLQRKVPRLAWASGSPVDVIVRQGSDRVYLTLINPSLSGQAKATINLAGLYNLAIDRGIERGFAVPLRKDNLRQAFDITLAPGEGTLIELLSQKSN